MIINMSFQHFMYILQLMLLIKQFALLSQLRLCSIRQRSLRLYVYKFDGHIPQLNISTPSLCIGLYKMLGKSPETEWTISLDNVHCVHGNWPLSEYMYNVH